MLGQVLLSVAAALLAAQAISAVLLLRAADERREQRLVGSLAVQLIAAANAEGGARRDQGPIGGRRLRIERSAQLPALPGDAPVPRLQRALAGVLVEEGMQTGAGVRVVEREALRDPRILQRIASGRPFGNGIPPSRSHVVLASVPRADGTWITARVLQPPRENGALRGLVMQTAVLFSVLMLAMWLILRRITRPLAALTGRVETFARTQDPAGQLAAEGPDDVRRLIAAHNAMEARIAAMLDEKDVMLGAIGHDLKTPLAALRVRIESVEDEGERARMAAGIEDIVRTLDDILTLARIGRAGEPPERTELAALAASVVEEFEDMGDDVTLADGPRVVAAVQVTWAKRALRNLVSNAVRYAGGAEVAVSRERGEAVLRVSDHGPGIPPDRIGAMTEPFVRGEASRNRATGGAGLGLTLARAIAEAHGGRLVLANRPEGGLAAELRLPF
nr:HAMP domain-containing sensor histidine kinase [Tsuneonella aeria]